MMVVYNPTSIAHAQDIRLFSSLTVDADVHSARNERAIRHLRRAHIAHVDLWTYRQFKAFERFVCEWRISVGTIRGWGQDIKFFSSIAAELLDRNTVVDYCLGKISPYNIRGTDQPPLVDADFVKELVKVSASIKHCTIGGGEGGGLPFRKTK